MSNYEKHNVFQISKEYESQGNPTHISFLREKSKLINPVVRNKETASFIDAVVTNDNSFIRAPTMYSKKPYTKCICTKTNPLKLNLASTHQLAQAEQNDGDESSVMSCRFDDTSRNPTERADHEQSAVINQSQISANLQNQNLCICGEFCKNLSPADERNYILKTIYNLLQY